VWAQDHNPLAGDPKAAKAGEYEFRINCALCHGLGQAAQFMHLAFRDPISELP
jgi:mono/diheme cytochrome c family protein